MTKEKRGKHTVCIHEGQIEDKQFGGAISPIYMATSYPFLDVEDKRYPRYFNTPNQEAVATKVAALENAEKALPFSSGMSAITTSLFAFLKSGDHVVFQNELLRQDSELDRPYTTMSCVASFRSLEVNQLRSCEMV